MTVLGETGISEITQRRLTLAGSFDYRAQHLYLDYVDPPDTEAVRQAYDRIDAFAGEIKNEAEGKYDIVVFLSDNGAARKNGFRPTHFNRPFYSIDREVGLNSPNIRDFYHLILGWVAENPRPVPTDG